VHGMFSTFDILEFFFLKLISLFLFSGIARVPTAQHSAVVVTPLDSVSVIQINNPSTQRQKISDGYIEIAPQIVVPDIPAGPSISHQVDRNTTILPVREKEVWNDEVSDKKCVEVIEHVKSSGLCEVEGKIF